jgi:hypothetical protein
MTYVRKIWTFVSLDSDSLLLSAQYQGNRPLIALRTGHTQFLALPRSALGLGLEIDPPPFLLLPS